MSISDDPEAAALQYRGRTLCTFVHLVTKLRSVAAAQRLIDIGGGLLYAVVVFRSVGPQTWCLQYWKGVGTLFQCGPLQKTTLLLLLLRLLLLL